MAFIQIFEYETSKPEEVRQLNEEWEQAAEGKHNAARLIQTRHHDDPSRHCTIVFFDSYDEAMENSELPETQEYAAKLREMVDGEPTYFDLDVVRDSELASH
jgi:hypothetical protein